MRALRRSFAAALVAAAAFIGVSATASAQDILTLAASGGRYSFPILAWSTGGLRNTDVSQYEGTYELFVEDTQYNLTELGSVDDPLQLFGGRLVVTQSYLIGDFLVRREMYVPASGGAWLRYIDVIENVTTADRALTVEMRGVFGCCNSAVNSSNSNNVLEAGDLWWITDDGDPVRGDTAKSVVIQGPDNSLGGLSTAQNNQISSRASYFYSWSNVSVGPGGRAVFLTFAGQNDNAPAVTNAAQDLTDPTDDPIAMFDLDPYLDDIRNFQLKEDVDSPEVRWNAPRIVDEGAPFTIGVNVRDPNGTGTVTFAWDTTPDDGVAYGEFPNQSVVNFDGATTDGPDAFAVSLRAVVNEGTADEHVSERVYRISVANIAPEITSEPPLSAVLGSPYQYLVTVEDPAGENDAIEFEIAEAPDGAIFQPVSYNQSLLRWLPGNLDVTGPGETILFQIIVRDGQDGGEATQSWELRVEDNRRPEAPDVIFPTDSLGTFETQPRLVVRNAFDQDLDDRLVYFFEIDTVDTFEGVNLRRSGPVAEQPGITYWYVEPELPPGRYFWRARASDGSLSSEWVEGEFWVLTEPVDAGLVFPDAGPIGGGDDDGCAVGGGGQGAGSLVTLVGAALALGLRRRRRR